MERIDQWPRVHTCLRDWCPKQSDDCKTCDAVVKILRKRHAEKPDAVAQDKRHD